MILIFACISTWMLAGIASLPATPPHASHLESFTIERAHAHSDLNQIAETINLAYQRQPFNREGYPRITVDALEVLLRDEENQLFIARSDRQTICGTVLLHGSHISLLSVHPLYQKQGLGLRLLEQAEKEAFQTYSAVSLQVIPLFQEKLIEYYQSVGYEPVGEVEPLPAEKLKRIQERYHSQVGALTLRKENR